MKRASIALAAVLALSPIAVAAQTLGPTFGDEVRAAGLSGLPFSWNAAGVVGRENLTASQQAALDAVIAAHNATAVRNQNVIPFNVFIARWTDAEYAKLLQSRATAVTAGNVTLIRQWDQASASNSVDLNKPAATNFKAALVSAAILTQARADTIFQ